MSKITDAEWEELIRRPWPIIDTGKHYEELRRMSEAGHRFAPWIGAGIVVALLSAMFVGVL